MSCYHAVWAIWAACPESEDHDFRNGDFPFMNTEIVRNQL